jgi:hypothetical protein
MEKAIANITNFQLMVAILAERIKQYEDAGFTNCENVVKLRNKLSQMHYDKYADKYPGYLFFTDEQFDKIVQRNKLVISTCEAYTGSIPDNCFEAIKNEKIDPEDYRILSPQGKIIDVKVLGSNNTITVTPGKSVDIKNYISEDKSTEEIIRYISEYQNDYGVYYSESEICKSLFNKSIGSLTPWDKLKIEYIYDNEKTGDMLHIAAPSHEIDKSKNIRTIVKEVFTTKTKDPIVFRYVNDGVLVITFWK